MEFTPLINSMGDNSQSKNHCSSSEQINNNLTAAVIKNEIKQLIQEPEPISHQDILEQLLQKIEPVDFRTIAQLESDEKPKVSHYRIKTVEHILHLAKQNYWGICKNHDFVYLFNGAYWSLLDPGELQHFLGEAAEKMGVHWEKSRDYLFRKQLFEQFMALANLPKPPNSKKQVLINLQNGTFEISPERQELRKFKAADFITYQLPFAYDAAARAPLFNLYLDTVLPDLSKQKVLAEYVAYIFIQHSTLKLEKTLLLYGSGANGKSVFFEIVNALLGEENVSSYSLQSLTNDNGYFRAKLANKLLNYASEINGSLETAIFKQLVSGEPVEARLPYGEPFTMTQYAKLIFNCNDLPKDVEHSHAYFRRFLIIPFDITIAEENQDKQLAQKIIRTELSGVFNWALEGLKRLLQQKKFTECEAVNQQLEEYKRQSDSVKMFLDESGYEAHIDHYISSPELYIGYKQFCMEDGFRPLNKNNFLKRIKALNIEVVRRKNGYMIGVIKNSF